MLSGIGVVAVRGEERHRRHPAAAVSSGSGLALIVDEFALLPGLRQVCWARQGRISIDIGVGGIALTGPTSRHCRYSAGCNGSKALGGRPSRYPLPGRRRHLRRRPSPQPADASATTVFRRGRRQRALPVVRVR